MKRSGLVCLLILMLAIVPCSIFADSSTTYDMSLFLNLVRLTKGEWIFGYNGDINLKFKSKGERNVKGEIDLELFSPDLLSLQSGTALAAVSLKKAFIKANFMLNADKSQILRWTIGKTRLSWGEGAVFNAGDVLFGSVSPYLDFTESELRNETAWMTALNFQLSPFIFLEMVVLPPEMDLSTYLELSLPGIDELESAQLLSEYELPGIEKSSLGMRLYAELGEERTVKLETGYLYSGEARTAVIPVFEQAMHRIYFGLEGNRFFNWQITSSVSFPVEDITSQWELVGQMWNISAGVSYIHSISSDSSLSFRLETLWTPFGFWNTPDQTTQIESPGRGLALMLYPEISYSPISTLNLFVRSMISPIDASAMFSMGVDWNVYKGLNIMAFANFNGGDEKATFAWDRGEAGAMASSSTGFSMMTGMRYRF